MWTGSWAMRVVGRVGFQRTISSSSSGTAEWVRVRLLAVLATQEKVEGACSGRKWNGEKSKAWLNVRPASPPRTFFV